MNKILLLFLGLSLVSWASVDNWKPFKDYDGRFSVLAPGELEKRTTEIETDIGTVIYNSFIYQAQDEEEENLVYMVSYCDYPEYTIHSDSTELIESFFGTTVESSVESVQGELIYATDINLGTYPGKHWRVNYNDNKAVIKTKAYVVGQRYYSVQAITYKYKSLNQDMDKFLDSFQLLSEGKPKPNKKKKKKRKKG